MREASKIDDKFTTRLAVVRERIVAAAHRSGRSPDDIRLIAVTKTFPSETVQMALDAGLLDIGENRVQEATEKFKEVTADQVTWHLIGHLQSNKVRPAVATFDVIHTIDSTELALRVDRIAREMNKRISVLVQVDLAGEQSKSGIPEAKLQEVIEALGSTSNIDLRGLMTLPPFFEDPEATRPYFRRLREVRDELNQSPTASEQLSDLSMGMSNDFEVAIEEGSTMIRLGTVLFGRRS